jgi:hypothetical protein
MKRALLVSLVSLGCTHPRPVQASPDPDALAIDRAAAALASPDCASFAVEERTPSYAVVAMREIHDSRCAGDPQVSPIVHRVRVERSGAIELYDTATDSWLPAPSGEQAFRVASVAFAPITAVDQHTADARIGRTLALGSASLTYAGEVCTIHKRESVATDALFEDVSLTAQQRAGIEPTATELSTDCDDEANDVFVTSRAAFLIRDGVVYVLASTARTTFGSSSR